MKMLILVHIARSVSELPAKLSKHATEIAGLPYCVPDSTPGFPWIISFYPREPRIAFGPSFSLRETEAQNSEVTWSGLLNQKVVGGLVWRPNSGAAVLEFSVRVSHTGERC